MADNFSYINKEAVERAGKDRFNRANASLVKLAILQSLPPHEKIAKLVEVLREIISDNLALESRIEELEDKVK